MPKPSKASSSTEQPVEVPFEEALKKLEAIVEQMESDDLPLETLLTRFEEGTQLVQLCQARLAEAELKLQKLGRTASGELELEPIEVEDTPAAP